MSSPSTSTKVNRLVIRYLHFWSVRGDLQEGHDYGKRLGGYDKLLHDYASRWQFLSSLCQFLPSRSPLTSSRAQNRGFCALFAFGTPIFGTFEHKIEVFVSEWAIFPKFWVVLTQNRGFCAREGPTAAEDLATEDSAAEDQAAEDSVAEESPDAAG